MYLTKEQIQQSFDMAMIMMYELSLSQGDGSSRSVNDGSLPITPNDITSRFTREEFEALAVPCLMKYANSDNSDMWTEGLKIDVACQFVRMEYERAA